MKKLKILVIDDEDIIHDIVSFMLNSRGYNTICVSNGELGLTKARNEHPDLILLDIMMPGLDGHKVCARLKADKDTKRIPVIMLTGESDREAVVKAREIGANDYVVKPFTLSILLERIEKILGNERVRKSQLDHWWQRLFKMIKRN